MVKEHPILFSSEMVRAILDGRKTQTRRVVKGAHIITCDDRVGVTDTPCPYGEKGTKLWVRETYCCHWGPEPINRSGKLVKESHKRVFGIEHPQSDGTVARSTEDEPLRVWYRASGEKPFSHSVWHPSIHMPRWASRIALEVVSVRVERVQGISDADCLAEGIDAVRAVADGVERPYREAYARLWDQINGKTYPWASNPWVWVVEFRRVDKSGPQATALGGLA